MTTRPRRPIFAPVETPGQKRLSGIFHRSLADAAQDILGRPNAFQREPITGREAFDPMVLTAEERGNRGLVAEVQRLAEERQRSRMPVTREPLRPVVETARRVGGGAITGAEAIAETGLAATQRGLTMGPRFPTPFAGLAPGEESVARSKESLREVGALLTGQRGFKETVGGLAARQRERPLVEQFAAGAIFDPLNLLPGVGYGPEIVRGLRVLKGAGREAVEGAIRNAPRTAEGIRAALSRVGDRFPEVKRALAEEGGFARLGGEAGGTGIPGTEKAALTRQLKAAEQELLETEKNVASGKWAEGALTQARAKVSQYQEAQRRARAGMTFQEVYDAFLTKPAVTPPAPPATVPVPPRRPTRARAAAAPAPAAEAVAPVTEGVLPPRGGMEPSRRRLTIAEQEEARLEQVRQQLAALAASQETAAARPVFKAGDRVLFQGDERLVKSVDIDPGGERFYRLDGVNQRVTERQVTLVPSRQAGGVGGRATPPSGMATLSDAQVLRGFREATKKSHEFGEKRAALPPGTSRARVTTANARWATHAESRDRYAQEWMRRYPDRPIEEAAGGVVRKEAVEDIAAVPPAAPPTKPIASAAAEGAGRLTAEQELESDLLFQLLVSSETRSRDAVLRAEFGDAVLDGAYSKGLITRDSNGIYSITVEGDKTLRGRNYLRLQPRPDRPVPIRTVEAPGGVVRKEAVEDIAAAPSLRQGEAAGGVVRQPTIEEARQLDPAIDELVAAWRTGIGARLPLGDVRFIGEAGQYVLTGTGERGTARELANLIRSKVEAAGGASAAQPPTPTRPRRPSVARRPVSATLGGVPEPAIIQAESTAAGVTPPSPAAAPPKTRVAQLRLSIRETKREGGGFLVSGRDTKGRQVRVFANTLQEAKQARANIRQGLEPFPGTEAEAQARALTRAERKYRAALKRGEAGAIQRAETGLRQVQEAAPPGAAKPPAPPVEPPSLPPRIGPDGGSTPPPSFDAARTKLVSIIRGAGRKGQQEIQAARAAERSRRFAQSRGATEAALGRGESPLPGIRAAQRGELPIAELALADRLTGEEVAVLRDRIYKTLGPELDWTSANIEEALVRLGTEGKIPTDSELQWMEEIFGPELVEALRAQRTGGQKALSVLLEVWNLPRALLASFDDSMVLRQGLHLLPEGAPAARALKAHVRAITRTGSDAVVAEIRSNPWFNHARAHGLDMSLPSAARGLGGREEVFMGAGIAQRIPILGKGVQVSERIATAYLNKLRMETYAAHAEELTRIGAGFDAFKDLATNINILSGRASLGRVQAIAPFLNGIFFSARLNWAAAQRPFRILKYAPDLNTAEGRHMAKMLAKDVYGMWAAIGGMVGLAAAAGVAVVELDPRSSDFGKMQVGTVRVDPWAGQQQWATMMARIVSGETKTTTTRQIVPADMVNVLGRFIESKVHPALGQLITIKEGKTYVGEDLTVKEFAKSLLPLFVQDIGEVVAGTTPGVAGILGTAAFFGVSVYNIPGVPATVLSKLQSSIDAYNAIPTDTLKLSQGQISRTEYRKRNPDGEAAIFLAGQVTSLSTSAAVRALVTLIQDEKLNPDNIRGVAERKERLQEAAELGKRLDRTAVDDLIAALEGGRGTSGAPSRSVPSRTLAPRRPTFAPSRGGVPTRSTPRRRPTFAGAR